MLARFIKRLFSSDKSAPSKKIPLHDLDDITIGPNESIYDALEKRGLLVKPRFPISLGRHLIRDGELGLSLNNGKPQFLASGGRHTLWSVFNKFLGTVSITDKLISLGSVQIVTIDQGELGLAVKNGVNQILEPGRYILHTPNKFVKTEKANQQYIELGTHRRITVPESNIAIAFDKGKQIIITSEDTKDGPYETDSPTFSFNPRTGLKSTQLEEIKLDELPVKTREMIALKVIGLIRYKIVDPIKAFFKVKDVHSAIKLQAEATLTSVFAQLSIDQIGTSLSSTNVSSHKENKEEQQKNAIPIDLVHKATDLFIHEFRQIVGGWGVELSNLNILSMDFADQSFLDTLRSRAKTRMEADTNLANLQATSEVVLKEAERKRQQEIIAAEGKAAAMKIMADAELYTAEQQAKAAKILASEPLAAQLAILKAQSEVAARMGNNTVFMPHNLSLGDYGIRGAQGQMFWMRPNEGNSSATAIRSVPELERTTASF